MYTQSNKPDNDADYIVKNIINYRKKNKTHSSLIKPSNYTYLNKPKLPENIETPSRISISQSFNYDFRNKLKKSSGPIELHFIRKTNSDTDCGINCRNLKVLREIELKCKELIDANEKLEAVNKHLMNTLNIKDDMYMRVSTENYSMKSSLKNFKTNQRAKTNLSKYTLAPSLSKSSNNLELGKESFKKDTTTSVSISNKSNLCKDLISNTNLNRITKTKFAVDNAIVIKSASVNLVKKNATDTNNPIAELPVNAEELILPNNSKMKGSSMKNLPQVQSISSNTLIQDGMVSIADRGRKNSFAHKIPTSSRNIILNNLSSQKQLISAKDSNKDNISNKAFLHYEKIHEMTARNQKRKYKSEQRISFLSMDEKAFKKLISNELMKELYQLTLSDEEFITKIRSSSEDRLIAYCDVIGNLIKDYQDSIKLIRRIKSFLQSSMSLVNSVLQEDSTTCLLKNACNILDCERTTLFVHDRISDKLIVHSGKGLSKAEVKVAKDKGIIGVVFMSGERVKVDDAYGDVRFNKEIDLVTGFTTRNILCLPLKDEDGVIFGAIQSINKKRRAFNIDDEELMEIFSAQASAILKNSMNLDENSRHISRLKLSIQYSFKLEEINDFHAFTILTEDHLMTLFNTNASQVLFNSLKHNNLVHISKYSTEEKKRVGIINYVKLKKQFYGCQSVDDCEFYNNLIDLETGFSLLTFPIMNPKVEGEVLAIVQMGYGGRLVTTSRKPKEMDMHIIELFEHMVINWLCSHRLEEDASQTSQIKMEHDIN